METKRRREVNKIRNKIRMIQRYIQIDEATIDRFRYQDANLEYNTTQIAKLKAKNVERQQELEILEKRRRDVSRGLLDHEIREEYEKSSQEVKRKNDEYRKKKALERVEKEEKSARSKAYYQSGRQSDRLVRWNKRDADKSYKHFVKACDSIPDYMLKKLKNMPNNKGYIWRSVHCYGELPAEKGKPTVMFEKHNGVLIIHETTETECKIWHKKDKGRRTLHYSEMRRKKGKDSGSLMEYVKV